MGSGVSSVMLYDKLDDIVLLGKKEDIILVPDLEVDSSGSINVPDDIDIPDWIQNNAGWWAESLITDEDFVESMQWLVANGVIQI